MLGTTPAAERGSVRRQPVMKAPKPKPALEHDEEWHIQASGSVLPSLREDTAFHQILALARVMNGLRYIQKTMPEKKSSSPASARSAINSFLFMNALLFEGYKLVQRMRRNFQDYKAWPSGFGNLLRNPRFQRLFASSMKPARNAVVFHVGENDLARSLEGYDPDPVIFATGVGPEVGNAYYDLADLLSLRLYVGFEDSDEKLLTAAARAFGEARDFALAFLTAGDALIAESIPRFGFQPTRGRASGT